MTMLLMNVNHFLYFVVAAHEDTRSIMDMLRNNSKHTFHPAIDRLTSSCFITSAHEIVVSRVGGPRRTILEDHSHRRALIQNPQLSLWALLVRWIREYPSVQ